MTESRGPHPPIEDLAAFAEGHASDRVAIETHIDGCEPCAQAVLAAMEGIAFEALGDDRPHASREFDARARGELARVMGGKRSTGNAGGFGVDLDGFGMAGLFGGGGLGSVFFSPGPDLVLASGDHSPDSDPDSSGNPGRVEISRADPSSHAREDEVDRMLDRIRHALGDESDEHHGGPAGRMPFDEDHSGHEGSSATHEAGEESTSHDHPIEPDDEVPGNPWDHGDDDSHG